MLVGVGPFDPVWGGMYTKTLTEKEQGNLSDYVIGVLTSLSHERFAGAMEMGKFSFDLTLQMSLSQIPSIISRRGCQAHGLAKPKTTCLTVRVNFRRGMATKEKEVLSMATGMGLFIRLMVVTLGSTKSGKTTFKVATHTTRKTSYFFLTPCHPYIQA